MVVMMDNNGYDWIVDQEVMNKREEIMPEMLIGDPEMINIYMGGEKIKIGYSNLTQDLIL